MKELKLTKEEAELLQSALMYVYDKRLDMVKQNQQIITPEEREQLLTSAAKYWDLIEFIKWYNQNPKS